MPAANRASRCSRPFGSTPRSSWPRVARIRRSANRALRLILPGVCRGSRARAVGTGAGGDAGPDLEAEHDNLRAALTQTLQSGATEQALRLAGALSGFWHSRGHFSEGREWLEEALAKDTRPHAPAQGKALAAVAWLALYQWDLERMVAASDEGLELSAETRIEGSTAIFLRVTRGVAARERGDTGEATRLLEEALALSREAEDGWGLALALLNLGAVWRPIVATTSGR